MKTKYISEDGSEFDTRRQCKLYEEAKEELKTLLDANVKLQFETVGKNKFFKINSYAELWLYDEMISKRRNEKPQSLYDIFENMDARFPIWLRDDAKASKKSIIEDMENEIQNLKDKISDLQDSISKLKTLDSRSKSPLIENLNKHEPEVDQNNQQEIEVDKPKEEVESDD